MFDKYQIKIIFNSILKYFYIHLQNNKRKEFVNLIFNFKKNIFILHWIMMIFVVANINFAITTEVPPSLLQHHFWHDIVITTATYTKITTNNHHRQPPLLTLALPSLITITQIILKLVGYKSVKMS